MPEDENPLSVLWPLAPSGSTDWLLELCGDGLTGFMPSGPLDGAFGGYRRPRRRPRQAVVGAGQRISRVRSARRVRFAGGRRGAGQVRVSARRSVTQ